MFTRTFWFQEFGLTVVSFADFGLSLTVHGPSSMKSPRAELQPGPPLIHMITGSSLGFPLDSKK
jgi:hypothetical protein